MCAAGTWKGSWRLETRRLQSSKGRGQSNRRSWLKLRYLDSFAVYVYCVFPREVPHGLMVAVRLAQKDLADLQKDLQLASVEKEKENQPKLGILETFKAMKKEINEEKMKNAHLNEIALSYKRDLVDLNMKASRIQCELESRLQLSPEAFEKSPIY